MKKIELLTQICSQSNSRFKDKNGIIYIGLNALNKNKVEGLSVPDGFDSKHFFTGCEVGQLMSIINCIERKQGNLNNPIDISLPGIKIIDKLTYIFLECICYYLILKGHRVIFQMSCYPTIETSGINSSPLLLLKNGKKDNMLKYIERFRFDLYIKHYRRVIDGTGLENTNFLGKYAHEIDTFLKPFGIEEKCRDIIATVYTELVGNAIEHGGAECLIDIDIAPNYKKRMLDGSYDKKYYYGINMVILNFSETLLGDGIEKNILDNNLKSDNRRYMDVISTFSRHQEMFSDQYSKTDFCNITAFQNRISGRANGDETGGTGLPQLIKPLQEMASEDKCYVISGNRSVNFKKEYLSYKDGWIGFNDSNDYFNDKPSEDVCGECLIYMPGTAYNMTFIMEGKDIG